ncbi:hypothetical protein FA13DRAFT_5375 [Coprinellus micaceus]|uniref:DUF6533 domain-containing protein n=1 Tax=Coprinellus micaceus TaxID=71717 RepID=A0A4Y7U0B3_COPMI|nr:hypothetical protein FA13DRAFT_5375 [Coprinellus micaceus]
MNDVTGVEDALGIFERLNIRNYTSVACFVYLLLEHIETFEAEVKYVWETKFNLVKMLFLGARYIGLINVPMLLVVELWPRMAVGRCQALYTAIVLLMGVSLACSDAIAYIRVHALSNRSKATKIYLSIQFAVVYLSFYIVLIVDITNTRFGPSPFPIRYPCYLVAGNRATMAVPFALLIFSMFSVLVLSLFFATRNFRHSKSPLMKIFYVDGTLTFIILATVTAGKVILHLTGPPEYLILLAVAHQAAHSGLCARMLLRMRSMARRRDNNSTIGEHRRTAIYFAPHETFELKVEVSTAKEYSTETGQRPRSYPASDATIL